MREYYYEALVPIREKFENLDSDGENKSNPDFYRVEMRGEVVAADEKSANSVVFGEVMEKCVGEERDSIIVLLTEADDPDLKDKSTVQQSRFQREQLRESLENHHNDEIGRKITVDLGKVLDLVD